MTRSAHFYPGGAQLFGLRCAPLGLELVGGVFVGELQFFLDNVPKSGMTLPAGGSAARRRAPNQICRRPALFCLEIA